MNTAVPAHAIDAVARDGCIVLAVSAGMDLRSQTAFRDAALAALRVAAGRPVVLDLSALTSVSPVGLAHLVALNAQALALDTPLRVAIGDAWAVFGPFAVMGLDLVLSLFRTVADACNAATPGSAPLCELRSARAADPA